MRNISTNEGIDGACLIFSLVSGSTFEETLIAGAGTCSVASTVLNPSYRPTKNVGMSLFLDFLVAFAPGPADLALPVAHKEGSDEDVAIAPTDDSPLAAVVFKTISESVGDLSFVRVFSGNLKQGDDAFNTSRRANEP